MNKFLKPRATREDEPPMVVLFPDGHAALKPEGQPVEMDLYWYRRLADGDVLDVDPPPPATDLAAFKTE